MGTRTYKASMYMYDASETITINTASEYHALIGLSEGSSNDCATYLESDTGSITSTANNGGVLRCTDVGHGLTTGQILTLNGMGDAAHNGVTIITVIDDDTFDCRDISYNSAADTGKWQRGTSLTINSGCGGDYSINYSVSGTVGTVNKNFKFEMYKNSTSLDEFASETENDNTGNSNCGSGGFASLTGGDVLWIACENTSDTTNYVITHINVHIHTL